MLVPVGCGVVDPTFSIQQIAELARKSHGEGKRNGETSVFLFFHGGRGGVPAVKIAHQGGLLCAVRLSRAESELDFAVRFRFEKLLGGSQTVSLLRWGGMRKF